MMLALFALAAAEDPSTYPDALLPDPNPRPPKVKHPRVGTTAFRASIPAGRPTASARLALVEDFDGPFIAELTVRGRYAWRHFGLAAEVVATGGVSPYWADAGLGNAVLDARWVFGGRSTHALGVRGTFGVGAREEPFADVAWWGTVPSATVPRTSIALAYEGATARWVWHLRAGLVVQGAFASFGVAELLDVGAIVATVQPLAPRWDLVVEVEAVLERSPLHARGLARHDLGAGWTVDGGVALPIPVIFEDPTLQLLGRLERRW